MGSSGFPESPDLLRRPITRRRLLQSLAVTVAGVAAAACSSPAATPTAAPKAAEPAKAGAAPAPAGAAPAAAPSGGKLRIGAIFPLTGDLALLGEECWRGAEIARLVQNKKGGVLGKEIEFVKGDAPDANAAVSQANRLISSEKMSILIGTYSSTLAQAASEVAERNKVIYWEMGGIADPIVERGFQYLFRVLPSGSTYGIMAVDFTKESLASKMGLAPDKLKVAVVHEDALYGTTVGTAAEKRVKELGLGFAGREAYSSKATDLSPLVLKLKAAQPDVLIATSYIQDLLLFWKQGRELDFNVKAVIGTGAGYALTDFAKAMGDDVNGIFNVDITQYAVNPSYAKGIKEFVDLYQETFKSPPRSGHSLINYVGTLVLWETIAKAGSIDSEAVRKAALTIDIPNGETAVGHGVKFYGPTDKTPGQNMRAVPLITQWQKSEQLTVWPKEASVADIIQIPWPTWSARKR
jgi:branched-chain amino acid transport system substrate-binding protein